MVSPQLTLEALVGKTTDLPAMPEAALAVMREADSPNGTAQAVAAHISRDQSLAARVLKLVNSPYYGLSGEVVDLQQAVVVLGMRCVRNLAVVAAAYPWLNKPLEGYHLKPGDLWEHSIAVSVGAHMVATQSRAACPETSFTAGLLHDIGKCVLSVWLENRLDLALKLAIRDQIPFDKAERKVIGYDHQEVGAYLARVWGLPRVFEVGIAYHHDPDAQEEFRNVIDCVHVADFLTMSAGYGLGGDGLCYSLSNTSLERLRLNGNEIDELFDRFVVQVAEYRKMIDLLNAA